jgi:3-hydroxyacyl-[acyl-carrier-protein] dehydratase
MRFHLIDRIDACQPGRSVRARKLTSRSETFWRDGRMPEPLILEALCQAGTWLVLIGSERRRRAALLSVGAVEFRGDVAPGDVLELDVRVESISEESAVVSGTASVDGHEVLRARDVMCALIAADTLEDLEETARMQERLTQGLAA